VDEPVAAEDVVEDVLRSELPVLEGVVVSLDFEDWVSPLLEDEDPSSDFAAPLWR
jgi:hypothetical protein